MNELSKFLVESILNEDETPIKKVIVVYGGRFQPFHKGHYGTYQYLVKKFGKDNVFISSSNKVERPKSPFNFKEKVKIMTTMFNIPKSKIVQVKMNYQPKEILSKFDEETTAYIAVVGEKDSNRLGGKYFRPWKGKAEVGYRDGGYVFAVPQQGAGISGTETRNGLSVGSDEQKQNFFKNRAYGKFNATIFKMITDKLNEGIEIPKEVIEEWLINESSNLGGNAGSDVDDGPNFFFPNYDTFSKINIERATKIGWEVINMITSKDIEDYYEHPNYPNGPVKAVSFFPAGVIGNLSANNQVDIYSSGAYSSWYKHATRKASLVGYSLISDPKLKDDKKQSGDLAKGDKKLKDEFENSLNENITLPVKVGDTILTGRFKNKKVVVKSIGKDEHGMPTINGKKVVTFRLMKEGFHTIFEDEKEDEKYTHIGYGKYKLKGKEDGPIFKKDDSGKYVELDKGGETKPQEPQGKSLTKGSAGDSYKNQLPDNDPAKKQQEPKTNNKELAKTAIKNLKSRKSSNGESLDFETTSKGSMVIGVEHDDDKSTKETIKNIESLPKNTKVMFVGEGGMTKDDNGKIEFVGEQDEIRNATLNHFDNAEESSWDENANVYDNSSPVFDSVAKSLGGSKSKSNASIWSNMVSQGDDLDADDYLDDEGKEWLISQAKKGGAEGFDGEVDWNNLTDAQKEDLYQLNFRDDDGYDETEISKGQEAYNNFRQQELDRKIKEAEDNGYTVIAPVGNSHVDLWRQRNKSKSINEIAGTAVRCEKCNHSWDIEEDDKEKYLCHSCGWDSQQQEYDYDAFDSWQEKMGLNEDIDERSKGKLRPADLLRRKAAMAGKRAQIARRRKRTMMRRKSIDKLKKIAYKKAYLEVYKEFMEDLFPGKSKSDLTIQQAKVVHKNVLRKKKRVLKRARFKFLPQLRDAEVDKFDNKSNISFDKPNETNEQLAKGMTLRDIADKHEVSFQELKKEAQKGVKVEMEHTSDVNQAYDIAKDHLFEDPKYYTKLATIEEVGVGTGQSGVRMGYPSKDDLKRIEKRVKKQRSNTDSNQEYQYQPIRENINESKLLMEGGAYGHMNHPFDTEINLTFGQLKDIVNRALEGTLEYTREKTDGQALAISWRDGRLVAARNKGHLKNKGENALDIKGVSDKFQGRGGLSDAYNYAMKDLSNAIKSLSDKQRDKIFKQGACFMNLEVIYPTSVNVIPYGQALLVFHGTMEYNDEGVAIGENGEAARILAGMIKQVNKDVQDNYTIQGPPVVKLPKSQDLSKKRAKYSSQISKLQKEFGLKDTDGVANYHQAWWEQWVDKNSPSTLDNKTKMGLVKRWAFNDKSFRLDNKNITDEKTLEWVKKTDKNDQKRIGKQNLMKFEQIFLGLGAEVLEFTSSALTVNPDKAVRDMKKRIDQTIKDVKKSGDPKKIEKLKLELGRLNSIGGAKKIVPNEGIVFLYNGNTFKLTGTFASVNQILGIFF